MAIVNNVKLLLKRGAGDPSTSLYLGEPGFDTSNSRLYIGKGIGSEAQGIANESEIDRLDDYNIIQDTSHYIDINQTDASISRIDASLWQKPSVTSLEALTDTSIGTNLADDNVLQYNVDTSAWDNIAPYDASDYFVKTADLIDASDYYWLKTEAITAIDAVDTSLVSYINPLTNQLDASVVRIDAYNIIQDTSITLKFDKTGGLITGDVSIYDNLYLDGSLYAQGYDITLIPCFGEISISDASTTVNVPDGDVYVDIAPWDGSDVSSNMVINGLEGWIAPTISGTFKISCNMSFGSVENNYIARGVVFAGDEELDNIHWARSIGTGTDIGSASCIGLHYVEKDSSISFRIKHDDASPVNIVVYYANLNAEKIS